MLVIDVEIYKNYFLLSALQPSTGKVRHFEIYDGHRFDPKQLNAMMKSDTTISFNGNGFDLPLIIMSIYGVNVETIKRTADRIIVEKAPAWRILQDNNIIVPKDWDHIDIIEVPSGRSSLKIYGGRLNAPKLQDLPIEPNALITPEQRELLKEYCINDLETTWLLYQKVKKAVDLRVSMSEQYGVDLRSKSDAQIAETVIKSELEKHYGYEFRGRFIKGARASNITNGFRYKDPHVISFETDQLKRVFEQIKEHKFTIKENGSVEMPDWLKKTKIKIDGAVYQMGIGGLHSSEKSQFVRAENDMVLADWDVASYYPNIILQQRLAPESLGNPFLEVYESIVKRRLAAKKKVSELSGQIKVLKEKLAKISV